MPQNGSLEQWGWRDFEEILLCPVCLDVPKTGIVEQCRRGHHICASCRKNVDSCPLCKSTFFETRNFVVEELIRRYDILKEIMLLNSLVIEEAKKKKREKRKNGTPNAPLNEMASQVNIRRKVNTPNATKGLYPCRVPDCNISLPSGRLLNHVRTSHGNILTEGVVDFTDNYSHTWVVPYTNRLIISRIPFVLFVSGVGLIFLNMEILKNGAVLTYVQMALKFQKSQNFLGSIEFFSSNNNNGTTYCYNTRLGTVRETTDALLSKYMCYSLSKGQMKRICSNNSFKCKLRLSLYNQMEHNVLTVVDREVLKRLKAIRETYLEKLKALQVSNDPSVCTRHASNINRAEDVGYLLNNNVGVVNNTQLCCNPRVPTYRIPTPACPSYILLFSENSPTSPTNINAPNGIRHNY